MSLQLLDVECYSTNSKVWQFRQRSTDNQGSAKLINEGYNIRALETLDYIYSTGFDTRKLLSTEGLES